MFGCVAFSMFRNVDCYLFYTQLRMTVDKQSVAFWRNFSCFFVFEIFFSKLSFFPTEASNFPRTCFTQSLKQNYDLIAFSTVYVTFQTATQLLSSPKCTAQKKKEYTKSVTWSAKHIANIYENKLAANSSKGTTSQVPAGLLDGLLGQLQIQAPMTSS